MYTIEIFKKGVELLGITDREIMKQILNSNYENKIWIEEQRIKKEEKIRWENRFKVPQGLTKKQLTALQKDTQKEINFWKEKVRVANNDFSKMCAEDYFSKWIEKKKKIVTTLKFHDKFGTEHKLDIPKARQYPVDQLLEFNYSGFAKCLWHEEKSGSMHYDKKRNKVHCFAGCGYYDAIDIYQKINNVSFNEAVKQLSK